jgi:hypothetical protein
MARLKGDSGLMRAAKWNFDLSPGAACRFVADMREWQAEKNQHKREEIAARAACLINEHRPRRAQHIRTHEVAEVFTLLAGAR